MADPVDQIAASDPDQALPVDVEDQLPVDNDADSAYGASLHTESTSLRSSVFKYKYENGRSYHAFKEGSYFMPNDEAEMDRLDMFHAIFKLLLGGGLYKAPIAKRQRVLDMGTGTGIWAIDFADEHPESEVHGWDLSPIQPGNVPPNCKFYVDDVEDSWNLALGERFDFIHGRCLDGSIKDWSKLLRQVYENLNPGGYVEFQDTCNTYYSDDGSLEEKAPHTVEFKNLLYESMEKIGIPIGTATSFKDKLIAAGFVNVGEACFKVPVGPWAKGRLNKRLGMWGQVQTFDAMEPYAMAMFTRVLGWTSDQVHAICAKSKEEFRRPDVHIYWTLYFTWGSKPEDPPAPLEAESVHEAS